MIVSPERFRALVSGEARGLGAACLRGLLWLLAIPYSAVVRWRNWRYDTERANITRVEVPVVCVGNLTLGGTGKTPMVEWVAKQLRSRGLHVALVSRGYRSRPQAQAQAQGLPALGSRDAANDEALELAQRLPNVPHVQNPDRVAAARRAIDEFHAEVIVLDDGFQHRRLARDLDIVLLDAVMPFGFDHLFPRGMLREPITSLHRAGVVILSRADMVDGARRASIRQTVQRLAPNAAWAEVRHAPQYLLSLDGETAPLDELREKRIAAFCGIGNPAGFRHTLDAYGYNVVDLREFPDHHAYTAADVETLSQWATDVQASALVCTHKDLVKIDNAVGAVKLWAMIVGLEFISGQSDVENAIDRATRR